MPGPVGETAAKPRVDDPLIFFLLVLLLAVPFWIAGGAVGVQLMPGLPAAALMFVCPDLAAGLLAARSGGAAAVGRLFARAFDGRRIPSALWLVPILFIRPAASLLSIAVQRLQGVPVPDPQVGALTTLGLCALFLVAALGEEIGWSGYASEPLVRRWGPLGGALILGAAWAVFHFVALIEAHRSIEWIAWWTLGALSMRVIMMWIFIGTRRSVFAVALFHAAGNVAWQVYPVRGSFFDPRIDSLILTGVALLVAATPAMRRGRPADGGSRP